MTSCGSDPLHLRFAAHANFVPEGTAVAVGEAAAAATGLRGGVAFVAAADGFTTGAGEREAAGSTTTGDEGTGALAAFQHTTRHATERNTCGKLDIPVPLPLLPPAAATVGFASAAVGEGTLAAPIGRRDSGATPIVASIAGTSASSSSEGSGGRGHTYDSSTVKHRSCNDVGGNNGKFSKTETGSHLVQPD